MTKRGFLALASLGGALVLGGCWESSDVVVHEAGKYKGRGDPLLDPKKTAERDETLKKRFQLVQADR
jgi:hypothetical protein